MWGSAARPVIESFTGEYRWSSNYFPRELVFQWQRYPSAAHAFAAAKTLDPAERAKISACPTPGQAKKAGQSVTLRKGWDDVVRYESMGEILQAKFADPELAQRLAATGDALLVEGTTWHDQHWGDCGCATHREFPGRNHLASRQRRPADSRGAGSGEGGIETGL